MELRNLETTISIPHLENATVYLYNAGFDVAESRKLLEKAASVHKIATNYILCGFVIAFVYHKWVGRAVILYGMLSLATADNKRSTLLGLVKQDLLEKTRQWQLAHSYQNIQGVYQK
jgi:hypothetical protein